MSKKYVNEIPKLPDDHHLAVTHECYNYPSWLDYLDSKGNYHFDKWRDDSNYPGIDDKLKFRWKTDITKEIFPFVREKSRNMHPNDIGVLYGAWWLHEQEVRGMDHVGFKEAKVSRFVLSARLPPWMIPCLKSCILFTDGVFWAGPGFDFI